MPVSEQTHKLINNRLAENRRILNSILSSPIYKYVSPYAGIHTFMGIEKSKTKFKTEDEICLDLLKSEKILVHPGYFYDYSDEKYFYICFSLLTNSIVFRKSLERLNDLLIRN
jgi:aspartate/methionine/tyrosine aminotransferase